MRIRYLLSDGVRTEVAFSLKKAAGIAARWHHNLVQAGFVAKLPAFQARYSSLQDLRASVSLYEAHLVAACGRADLFANIRITTDYVLEALTLSSDDHGGQGLDVHAEELGDGSAVLTAFNASTLYLVAFRLASYADARLLAGMCFRSGSVPDVVYGQSLKKYSCAS